MNTILTPEIQEVMGSLHYRPSVSIIMPFEPKIGLKTELAHSLKTIASKAEKELLENYPVEVCAIVTKKLKKIIRNLNFDTHQKSIAIYVSPVFQKVFYLDNTVNEKITLNDSSGIRDLVYNKKQLDQYLVLLLSRKKSQAFLINTNSFLRIVPHAPELVYAYVNASSETAANFPDQCEYEQILTDELLNHIDIALDEVIQTYPLPIFVLGAEKILDQFKKLTRHTESILEYVHGDYNDTTFTQLKEILKPHTACWHNKKKNELLIKLKKEACKNKVIAGIKNISAEATNHQGRLLVVEKNFRCAALHNLPDTMIDNQSEPFENITYIKDSVDDVIEKVLKNGGDVEFVNDGDLEDYSHIALIKYY